MANIWDTEEQVSEYELIADDAQQAEELAEQYASSPAIVEADEEVLEEIAEESAFELSNQESNTIYNARLRLEQAKLYEMLINHNLFEGVDVSPEAVKAVQNELKFYIVKRLEILLGLREPTAAKAQVAAAIELPFNDVEVDFLKQLAYKGTLGASVNGKPLTPVQKPVIKPLTASSSSQLKPLAVKKKAVEQKPEPKVEQPKPTAAPPKPAPQAQKAPVQAQPAKKPIQKPAAQPAVKQKKQSNPQDIKTGVGERKMTEAEAIAIAKADLATASKKPFHEMTAKEKAERIRQANERNARPKATNAMPMPSPAELEMRYMTQQQNRSYSKNSTDQFNVAIATALANRKNRGDDNE